MTDRVLGSVADSPHAGTLRYQGQPWLTVLNRDDIEIVSDSLSAAMSKLHRVHPEESAMWGELCDLCADLHASWERVWR